MTESKKESNDLNLPAGRRRAGGTPCEYKRLQKKEWKAWGSYLTDRQWGTVREDYSANGTAWEHVPHDAARSKAFRWGEEGIAGISDEQ